MLHSALIFLWILLLIGCITAKSPFDVLRKKIHGFTNKRYTLRGGASSENKELAQMGILCPHWMKIEDCLETLDVSEKLGLSNDEATNRLFKYGPNALTKAPSKSLLAMIVEQFEDRLVQILLAVASLSAVLAAFEKDMHAVAEPLIILTILVINALVSILQSKSAEDSLDALKKLQPDTACVLRNGVWISDFPTASIVPGDIVNLRVGDKVPADARIIRLKTNNFNTDEGSLTGESKTVAKCADPVSPDATSIPDKINMVFSGTMVTNGNCLAVVTSTGKNTEIGKINEGVELAKLEQTKTPLASQLDKFGDQLTRLIGGICVLVWVSSIPKFSNPAFASWYAGAVYYAKTAVALGVAAIPEGLPAVITMCLSLGTKRMASRNVIVRKLSSVETLGCTSVICTDKTGTLTTNKMTVKSMVTFSGLASVAPAAGTVGVKEMVPGNGIDKCGYEYLAAHKDLSAAAAACTSGAADKSTGVQVVERHVHGVSYDPIGAIDDFHTLKKPTETTAGAGGSASGAGVKVSGLRDTVRTFASIASLCNEAQIEYKDGQYGRIGEPTEAALKVLVEKLGQAGEKTLKTSDDVSKGVPTPEQLADQYSKLIAAKWETLSILEFSRDRKSMSVLVRPRQKKTHTESSSTTSATNNALFVKGAAELVALRCNRLQLEDGSVVPITAALRVQITRHIDIMAQRPMRCLALAYKAGPELGPLNDVTTAEEAAASPSLKDASGYASIESNMILVGLTGIVDPARTEAAEAIQVCTEAGIRVMMITGDCKETAVAIAKDVNIFPRDMSGAELERNAFTGKEFFHLNENQQLDLLREGNKVFCRAEPRDKQRLISMLSRLGEVTAMTGDGVNDAPALQQADIGIAMGITGTEVAKGAADMVLADDNFATIVAAVEEGRNIYTNMQSFVCFLLSCNIGEIACVLLATVMGLPEPLSPLHLLWVNLVTDGPPATALGYNPSDAQAMRRQPRAKGEPLMSTWLLVRYLIVGAYVGTATVAAYISWYLDKGVTLSQLMNWQQCGKWVDFAHSADAPHWPYQPCDIFSAVRHRAGPQTMALSVLVTIELLKALSAVSLDSSLLQVPFWKNRWLIPGVGLPFALHLMVMYVPFFRNVLGLAPLSWSEWKVVLAFSVPILLLEEVLKGVGRDINKRKALLSATKSQKVEKNGEF